MVICSLYFSRERFIERYLGKIIIKLSQSTFLLRIILVCDDDDDDYSYYYAAFYNKII